MANANEQKILKYALENQHKSGITLILPDSIGLCSEPIEFIPGVPVQWARRTRGGWVVSVDPKILIEVLRGRIESGLGN